MKLETPKDCWIADNIFHYYDSNGVAKYCTLEQLKQHIQNYENRLDPIGAMRKAYFAMRDRLYSEGNTGYTKIELHELAKQYIFPKLVEDPDNFVEGGKEQNQLSVTWLSEKGWQIFLEGFKSFAVEHFNFYL